MRRSKKGEKEPSASWHPDREKTQAKDKERPNPVSREKREVCLQVEVGNNWDGTGEASTCSEGGGGFREINQVGKKWGKNRGEFI